MYVLDEDPKKSAEYLIRQHIYKYLKDLEYSFASFNLGGKVVPSTYFTIQNLIMYSKENYLWFSKYYEAIKDVYNKCDTSNYSSIKGFDIKFLYKVDDKEFENNGLKFPCALDKFGPPRKYFYQKYVKGLTTPIDINRIMYIINNYKVDSFIGSIPPWYSSVSRVIYSGYNKKDRNRVKVALEGHRYKYYISAISDKWLEIENVPVEIEYIINSMLYNKF